MSTAMVYAAALLALLLPVHGLQLHTQDVSRIKGGSGRFLTSSSSSRPSLTALHLLKGMLPTVDDDIERETEDANLSSFELFKRELEEGASIPAAIAAVRKRSKDKAGDYENKVGFNRLRQIL